MEQWDGSCDQFIYIPASNGNLFIDENGTIYVKNSDGSKYIWCSKERLKKHIQRLWQVCGESTVINKNYRIK